MFCGNNMKILAIEDEELTQQFIQTVLSKEYQVHIAGSGEEGLQLAGEIQPDMIILDVNMPGMNGYEVCERLKQDTKTESIPVVFLSAHSDLEERMQGYAVGAEDYLVKPCEPETIRAKIKVLINYREQCAALKKQFTEARKIAHIAMTGNSELGMVIQFVQNSYALQTYDDLSKTFFDFTNSLNIHCALIACSENKSHYYSSTGAISPLEKELLDKACEHKKRIIDFEQRTFISYPYASLFVKNMPIDDAERYGRIKDVLPIALGVFNNKIFALNTEKLLHQQSEELTVSFDNIKTALLSLSNSLGQNQQKSMDIMRGMMSDLNDLLPGLGLEEDQEELILNSIEKAVENSHQTKDVGEDMNATFQTVINELQQLLDKQKSLLDKMVEKNSASHSDAKLVSSKTSDVDLF